MEKIDQYAMPEIFEKEATGRIRLIYGDIKHVLKVPVVNFIFRATALYESFLDIGWSQVRSNMLTANMEKAAQHLRYPALSVQTPKINWSMHDDTQTLETIRRIIFIFNYVNAKLLLIASAWSESLSNRSVSGGNAIEGYIQPGIMPHLPDINLVHIPDAPVEIGNLLLDIAKVHQSIDVASDFRALANYPEFLSSSWYYLRDYVGTDEYNLITANLKSRSIEMAHNMPYPVSVNRKMLTPYYSDSEIAGIMGIVSMFQNFLPKLIIDGEFFRRIIDND